MTTEGHGDSPGPSLRDTIASAFESEASHGDADAGTTDTSTPYAPDSRPVPETGAAKETSYLPGDSTAKPADTAAAAPGTAPTPGPAGAVAPPAGWKDPEAWKTMSEYGKQFLKDREVQYSRGYQRIKQAADFGTGAFQALEPLMPALRAQGIHPLQALRSVSQLVAVLRSGTDRERAEAFAGAAQEYRVDLQALVEQGLPADSTPDNRELQLLKRKYDALAQHVTGQQNQQQMQWAVQNAEAFRSRPEVAEHLPYVFEDMARILESSLIDEAGKSADQLMQEAFDLACHRNPSIRKQRETQALSQQAGEAKRLRNAASVSSSASPIAGNSLPTDMSTRGILERAWPA